MDGLGLLVRFVWSSISFLTYWIYSISLSALSFLTITLPKTVFGILHWSGFISVEINFQKLLILFFLIAVISSWTFKLKVLNKYQSLPKSPQLNKSFQNRVAFQDLNPTLLLNSKQLFNDHNHFNNYLDEFLSAIRVFGFLEKPVFHELARHLQTRRLLAGDTLSLDEDKSFYIVVDGTVQVFAKATDRPNSNGGLSGRSYRKKDSHLNDYFDKTLAYDNEDDTGFQLLNVVESGGTLSSLFTILSLFTEDVKLKYDEDEIFNQADQTEVHTRARSSSRSPLSPPNPNFPLGSSQSSRRADNLGGVLDSSTHPHDSQEVDEILGGGTAIDKRAEEDGFGRSSHGTSMGKPHSSTPIENLSHFDSQDEETPQKREGRPRNKTIRDIRGGMRPSSSPRDGFNPSSSESNRNRHSSFFAYDQQNYSQHRQSHFKDKSRDFNIPNRTWAQPRESTVARATVDTTLAVIPSEAFKRLTSKIPNAVAHIVQVILTRLQRVTFLTSHQYLGLTKELLRTEKALNELASYPLPVSFFEDGGMVRLRQRLLSSTRLGDEPQFHHDSYHLPDHFSTDPNRHQNYPNLNSSSRLNSFKSMDARSSVQSQDNPLMTPLTYMRSPSSSPERQTSSRRRSGHIRSQASLDLSTISVPHSHPHSINHLHDDLELRRLVMNCIAKSIGLVQQSAGRSPGSNIGSTSIVNSPSLTPLSSISKLELASGSPAQSASAGRPGGGGRPPLRPGFRSGLGSLSYLKTFGGGGRKDQRDGMLDTGSSACSSSAAVEEEEEVEEVEDLPNEVEILFFPKDSTLVKAGERNAGLYFVIDGFLDVFMPSEESEQNVDNLESQNVNHHQMKDRRSSSRKSEERSTTTKRSTDRSSRTPSRKNRYSRNSEFFDDHTVSGNNDHSKSHNKSRSGVSTRTASKSSAAVHKSNSSSKEPKGNHNHHQYSHSQSSSSKSQSKSKNPRIKLFSIKPGGIAGYLASISAFPSYVDIRAKTDVYVGFLPARALERIMDRRPIVLLTLAKRLISLLSPLMTHIDTALEWMAVDAGQIIFREGDQSDSLYIVIGGRLRAISEQPNGGLEILAEYGQGQSIGELDCITNTKRKSTLHAIRDSELVRIPMTLFNAISLRHPAITIQVARLIASRVREEVDSRNSTSLKSISAPGSGNYKVSDSNSTGHGGFGEGFNLMSDLRINNVNLKTVAIVPNTKDVPIVEFASRLRIALEQMNSATKLLDQASILSVLGRHAFSRLGKLKLAGWLTELEQTFRIVLYVADTGVNAPWTQTCIRQADYIMMVCDGGSPPEIGEYERLLMSMKTTARKELVLLHPDRNVPAGSTRPWLRNRPWIHAHHHVEMAGATPLADNHLDELPPLAALKNFKQRVEYQISKYRRIHSKNNHHRHLDSPKSMFNDDFARLARRLCGKSIGVVLGGGGARGISHIGVIRALQEQGIPIDMIGGTSIGSFIGGLYARDSDLLSTLGRAKTFSGRMAAFWRLLSDFTYPVVAYTTGHEFNRGIYKSFYDYHIEDFWLPFWANTTNITWSRMEVHTTGYAWRYIRASMSLAGLLPPLCDEGDMLVDGGYIDNLPVSVMLRMGADSIFAVDVGSIDDTSPRDFPESISGWWLLINRFNPWSTAQQVPTMTDIQSRLTYVSSVKTLEEAKATPGVLYMRMPVTQYTTMDFGKFEEILKKGYSAAKEMLKEMEKSNKLPKIDQNYFNDDRILKFKNSNKHKCYNNDLIGRQRLIMVRRNSV